MLIHLEQGAARAEVSLRGGELHGWFMENRNLLWQRDPRWWDQSAPILFPIVGWGNGGRITVDGRSRPMGVHGFAARSAFDVVNRDHASVTLVLSDNDVTSPIYPFGFHLSVTYILHETWLMVEFAVENAGKRVMPYALGFHPGFPWPLGDIAREKRFIEFEKPEPSEVPVITPGGLISQRRRPIPIRDRRLALNDALFADEALCFLDANSRTFALHAGESGPSISLETSGFPHLALWSLPGAPFVSMEAWTGHSDPEGFAGELADKPSMRLLAPGAVARHAVRLAYRAGR
jgi:galactose mutarotase-like enzyme